MNPFIRPLLLILLCASACVTAEDTVDVDEPVDDTEPGKDDSSALRHYLLTANVPVGEVDMRSLSRAGGGTLRCMDEVVRDACAVTDLDLVPAVSLGISSGELLDELEDHPVIVRGRLARIDGRIVLRISAVTRGITRVIPSAAPCYRLRPLTGLEHRFELLDSTTSEVNQRLYFDDVDPTPDLWSQATPYVQAKIDGALELARTRPVYTCGYFDRQPTGDLFWGQQLFAPRR